MIRRTRVLLDVEMIRAREISRQSKKIIGADVFDAGRSLRNPGPRSRRDGWRRKRHCTVWPNGPGSLEYFVNERIDETKNLNRIQELKTTFRQEYFGEFGVEGCMD